jgi:hypothetical protein
LTLLYQDATKGALQVFLPNPELVTSGTASNGLILGKDGKPELSGEKIEGIKSGVWVNADAVGYIIFLGKEKKSRDTSLILNIDA